MVSTRVSIMPSDKQVAKRSNDWLRDMDERLDKLLDAVDDDVLAEMICIQIDLAKSADRCATRQKAAAKVMDFKIDALTLKMRSKLLEHDEDVKTDQVKVLVVDSKDLELAKARAAAIYQESVKKLT